VIYVEPMEQSGQYRLRQVPEISGAMLVMDPHTGRVLSMVGGFSFDESQFNRATQALRQPGSSFKPIVYATAIDNGYTPSTIILDAPLEVDTGTAGIWEPENYGGQFYGPSTLRFGLEESRNVMTVRLAQDIGMPLIAEYAKKFGVYDQLPPYLSYALGAGETTLMRMVTAYSMIDNGGRRVIPTLIDRIQDRYGHTIFKHDKRQCEGCDAASWQGQPEPTLIDHREKVLDPMTAYQITSMMEGVVHRLFAGHRLRRVHGLRQATPDFAQCHRRPFGGAHCQGLLKGSARRQAADPIPDAAWDQARSRRCEDRHARGAGRHQGHPRSLQAGHRAARQLFGHWHRQLRRSGACWSAGCLPRRRAGCAQQRHGRAILISGHGNQ
jgi:hypothetical protein